MPTLSKRIQRFDKIRIELSLAVVQNADDLKEKFHALREAMVQCIEVMNFSAAKKFCDEFFRYAKDILDDLEVGIKKYNLMNPDDPNCGAKDSCYLTRNYFLRHQYLYVGFEAAWAILEKHRDQKDSAEYQALAAKMAKDLLVHIIINAVYINGSLTPEKSASDIVSLSNTIIDIFIFFDSHIDRLPINNPTDFLKVKNVLFKLCANSVQMQLDRENYQFAYEALKNYEKVLNFFTVKKQNKDSANELAISEYRTQRDIIVAQSILATSESTEVLPVTATNASASSLIIAQPGLILQEIAAQGAAKLMVLEQRINDFYTAVTDHTVWQDVLVAMVDALNDYLADCSYAEAIIFYKKFMQVYFFLVHNLTSIENYGTSYVLTCTTADALLASGWMLYRKNSGVNDLQLSHDFLNAMITFVSGHIDKTHQSLDSAEMSDLQEISYLTTHSILLIKALYAQLFAATFPMVRDDVFKLKLILLEFYKALILSYSISNDQKVPKTLLDYQRDLAFFVEQEQQQGVFFLKDESLMTKYGDWQRELLESLADILQCEALKLKEEPSSTSKPKKNKKKKAIKLPPAESSFVDSDSHTTRENSSPTAFSISSVSSISPEIEEQAQAAIKLADLTALVALVEPVKDATLDKTSKEQARNAGKKFRRVIRQLNDNSNHRAVMAKEKVPIPVMVLNSAEDGIIACKEACIEPLLLVMPPLMRREEAIRAFGIIVPVDGCQVASLPQVVEFHFPLLDPIKLAVIKQLSTHIQAQTLVEAYGFGGIMFKTDTHDIDILLNSRDGKLDAMYDFINRLPKKYYQVFHAYPRKKGNFSYTSIKVICQGVEIDFICSTTRPQDHRYGLDFKNGAHYYDFRTRNLAFTDPDFPYDPDNKVLYLVSDARETFLRDPSILLRLVRILAKEVVQLEPNALRVIREDFLVLNPFVITAENGSGKCFSDKNFPDKLYSELLLLFCDGYAARNLAVLIELNLFEKLFSGVGVLTQEASLLTMKLVTEVAKYNDFCCEKHLPLVPPSLFFYAAYWYVFIKADSILGLNASYPDSGPLISPMINLQKGDFPKLNQIVDYSNRYFLNYLEHACQYDLAKPHYALLSPPITDEHTSLYRL